MSRDTEQPRSDHYGRLVRRRTALKLPLVLAAGAALTQVPHARAEGLRWTAERANAWYQGQGWLVGCNYITSTAVNQIEMFQPGTYDPRRIDDELRIARYIGMNTVRVFLHDQLWAQDRAGFQRRLAQFVSIAANRGIRPLFVFFDSCWDPHPKAGRQRPPTPGVHNSGWVQSPGADLIDDANYRRVRYDYVVGVMSLFRNDNRVLGWDLWNEPDNPAKQYKTERPDKLQAVGALLPEVFKWARAVNPVQPVTSGVWDGVWDDPKKRTPIVNFQLENSDIISFHNYGNPQQFEDRIDELVPLGRPIICTEYLARPEGNTIEAILPIMKRRNVGAYNWGLVAGKTQTFFPWDSWDHPYAAAPKEWFHDLLQPSGQAFNDDDIHTMRALTGADAQARS